MHCHITNWILLTNTLRAIVKMHLIHYFMYFSKNKVKLYTYPKKMHNHVKFVHVWVSISSTDKIFNG